MIKIRFGKKSKIPEGLEDIKDQRPQILDQIIKSVGQIDYLKFFHIDNQTTYYRAAWVILFSYKSNPIKMDQINQTMLDKISEDLQTAFLDVGIKIDEEPRTRCWR